MSDNPLAPPPGRSRVPRFREQAELDGTSNGANQGSESTGRKALVNGVNNGADSSSGAPEKMPQGFKFFNGRAASTPVQNAKKKALVDKLRAPAKPAFKGSSFNAEDEDDT